jgi:membrane protease YdiL (CAAX protease family)
MPSPRRFFRDHPLATFLPLAFALSWYPWLIALAQGRSTGPNPLGPFVAALLVLGVGTGWPAVKALLASMLRVRVAPHWHALAFGLPAAIVAACLAINHALGAPWPTAAQLAQWPDMIEPFLIILLFVALGEEPGWRGFLLPRLQQRFGALRASLVLGAIWALWHLPLLGTEFLPAHIAPFLVSVFAATMVLTRLYDGTRGSVLLPMLMHATVNTVGSGFAFGFYAGDELTRLWWINAGLWAIAGVVAAWQLHRQAESPPLPGASMGCHAALP